jgi:hypothetical protein
MTTQFNFEVFALAFLVIDRATRIFFSIRRSIEHRAQQRADAIYCEEMAAERDWADFSELHNPD